MVPSACRRAGLGKRLTTHGLRHTKASHLVMRSTPVTTLRELLGHADLTMVARYTHLSPDVAHAAVQVLDAPASRGNCGQRGREQMKKPRGYRGFEEREKGFELTGGCRKPKLGRLLTS